MALARLFIPLLLVFAPLHAEEKSPAGRLADLMEVEHVSVRNSMKSFQSALDKWKAAGVPEEGLNRLSAVAEAQFTKWFSNPELRNYQVSLIEKAFTNEEIEEIIKFYQTPTGKKLVLEMPLLNEACNKFAQTSMKDKPDDQEFRKRINEILLEYVPSKRESKTPTPATPEKGE